MTYMASQERGNNPLTSVIHLELVYRRTPNSTTHVNRACRPSFDLKIKYNSQKEKTNKRKTIASGLTRLHQSQHRHVHPNITGKDTHKHTWVHQHTRKTQQCTITSTLLTLPWGRTHNDVRKHYQQRTSRTIVDPSTGNTQDNDYLLKRSQDTTDSKQPPTSLACTICSLHTYQQSYLNVETHQKTTSCTSITRVFPNTMHTTIPIKSSFKNMTSATISVNCDIATANQESGTNQLSITLPISFPLPVSADAHTLHLTGDHLPTAVATFHKFADLHGCSILQPHPKSLCVSQGLKGITIPAPESIKSTIAGDRAGIDASLENLCRDQYSIVPELTEPFCAKIPLEMTVRPKPEIVKLGSPLGSTERVGTFVELNEWNAPMTDPELTTRSILQNKYIYTILKPLQLSLPPTYQSIGRYAKYAIVYTTQMNLVVVNNYYNNNSQGYKILQRDAADSRNSSFKNMASNTPLDKPNSNQPPANLRPPHTSLGNHSPFANMSAQKSRQSPRLNPDRYYSFTFSSFSHEQFIWVKYPYHITTGLTPKNVRTFKSTTNNLQMTHHCLLAYHNTYLNLPLSMLTLLKHHLTPYPPNLHLPRSSHKVSRRHKGGWTRVDPETLQARTPPVTRS